MVLGKNKNLNVPYVMTMTHDDKEMCSETELHNFATATNRYI